MARVCEICDKSYHKANLVPRGIGRRVTNRHIKIQRPNLRNKKIEVNGQKIKVRMCAACLKRLKKDARDAAATQSNE